MASGSLRMEQAESSRLAWAFALSLCVHLLVVGGYYTGNKFHVWDNLHWPAWLHPLQTLVEAFKKKPNPQLAQPLQPQDPPLMFVEVNPEQATAEPPRNAKYYSDRNSVAANPSPKQDSGVPEISGTQKLLPKTEDAPPLKEFKPLQPTPPPQQAQKAPEKVVEQKPKPAQPPGDLAMAKPEEMKPKDPGEAPRQRRPTVQELRAQQQANRLPGQMMQQDGGVKTHLQLASLDAKAVPWGAYDYALIAAIQQRWDALLTERNYAADGQGKVVLHFTLHYDGRVSDMAVAETTVNEVLSLMCQKAVLDPAPFQAWPVEMRRMMGETRNIQITFYYTY
jgi:outer membrane biosynthesis protein TonB